MVLRSVPASSDRARADFRSNLRSRATRTAVAPAQSWRLDRIPASLAKLCRVRLLGESVMVGVGRAPRRLGVAELGAALLAGEGAAAFARDFLTRGAVAGFLLAGVGDGAGVGDSSASSESSSYESSSASVSISSQMTLPACSVSRSSARTSSARSLAADLRVEGGGCAGAARRVGRRRAAGRSGTGDAAAAGGAVAAAAAAATGSWGGGWAGGGCMVGSPPVTVATVVCRAACVVASRVSWAVRALNCPD